MPRIGRNRDIPETVWLFVANLLKVSVRLRIQWIIDSVQEQFDWIITRAQVLQIVEEAREAGIEMNWE
jgi:hypothetical protein